MDLRYPVGKFQWDGNPTEESRRRAIEDIAAAPGKVRAAVQGLTPAQIDTPYRPEGWTVRQVVHHIADSHMNAFIRFRLALTENEPTIKPYDENLWSQLADSRELDPAISLELLDPLHQRWLALLCSMKPADFTRTLNHPETGIGTLDRTLALYAWHGRHHTAHITSLRERNGW
jgi:uncharacterized damage-inducible protein DinB